jgi:transcriptional regulator with XRE-family HTH domain
MSEKSAGHENGNPDPVLVELGRRLLRSRLRYGERMDPPTSVSQMAVGRSLGVAGVTVGAWEAGRNDPGVPMLYRLADLYGVRRVWLLTGDGEMYEAPPAAEPVVRQERPSDSLDVSGYATPRKHRRSNGGQTG